MNPPRNVAIDLLLAFREEPDAVQLIAEYLKTREMGPHDRSATRLEVRAFVRSGDRKRAENLVINAEARRNQALVLKTMQRRKKPTQG
jgi:hypothetical protein